MRSASRSSTRWRRRCWRSTTTTSTTATSSSARRAATGRRRPSSTCPASTSWRSTGSPTRWFSARSATGTFPTIASWIRDGGHTLLRWETDWSSQTGACQAGLLHGSNEDMPAFRWWEKDLGKPIVTNHPKDAAEIERRHSDGKGLLHEDGASRANILSGDAPHTLLTMSTVTDRDRPGRLGQDYYAYFSNPYSVTRTIMLMIGDIAQELYFAAQQRRRDIRPRIKRDLLLRARACVGDGDPARPPGGRRDRRSVRGSSCRVHHLPRLRRGRTPFRSRAGGRAGDAAPRRSARSRGSRRPRRTPSVRTTWSCSPITASRRARRSSTATARASRTSSSEACSAESVEAEDAHSDESLSYLGAGLTEAGGSEGMLGRGVRAVTRGKRVDGEVHLGEEGPQPEADDDDELPELSVMASGCLGLITFPREPGRVSLERIEELYPALMPALLEHPGIGFALVRSERARRARARRRAVSTTWIGRGRGRGPARPVRAQRRRSRAPDRRLRRTAPTSSSTAPTGTRPTRWRHSRSWSARTGGWVASSPIPFALAPSEWAMPAEPVVGAEEMHRYLRRWLADLGHDAYRDTVVSK